MFKELIILTKSSKFKKYCVAGIDSTNGSWIRLTSEDENSHGALGLYDLTYNDGTYCNIFDKVKVQIKSHNPAPYQPENYLIDSQYQFEKIDHVSISDVLKIHPTENFCNILNSCSPYVTEERISTIGCSLSLVIVENLIIDQAKNPYGEPKTKAHFRYNNYSYEFFSVTDPEYYRVPNNTTINQAAIVLSLPDSSINGRFYKFVCQIFEL